MENDLYRADDNTALRFFTQPVKNNFQSEQHGRAIFDTGLFVEVITPGSTESMPQFQIELQLCQEAGGGVKTNHTYYERFKAQIEAYKSKNGKYRLDGTPLSQWPNIDVGTVATLNAANIQTVDQLANVSDGNLGSLGVGGRTLREQARQFLQSRQFGVPSAQVGADIARKDERIAELEAENAMLKARVAALDPAQTAIAPAFEVPLNAAPVAAEGLGAFSAPETSFDVFAPVEAPEGILEAPAPATTVI
jgi:hypothetical protein